MATARKKKQLGWFNKTEMCTSLRVTPQAFDKWKIKPIAKSGRENFYIVKDVVDNRSNRKLELYILTHPEPVEDTGLNPVTEKALLDRSRREGQDLVNERRRSEVFPIEIAEFVFSKMGAEISAILESLPAKIKRLLPTTTATQMDAIRKEIAKARNTAADVNDHFDEYLEEYFEAGSEKESNPES